MLGQLAPRPNHVKNLQHRLARAVVLKAAIFFYDLQIFGQRLLVFARGGQGLGQFKARLQIVRGSPLTCPGTPVRCPRSPHPA